MLFWERGGDSQVRFWSSETVTDTLPKLVPPGPVWLFSVQNHGNTLSVVSVI